MMTRAAACVLLCGLLGCSARRGSAYYLHLDPAMATTQVEAAILASDDWNARVGVEFHRDVLACNGSDALGHICVHPATRATLCTDDGQRAICDVDGRTVPGDDGGDVKFDENAGPELQAILAHEFGHCIALPDRHLPAGTGALMTPQHESWVVTDQDVAVYWEARR